jgi:hypothetical protein
MNEEIRTCKGGGGGRGGEMNQALYAHINNKRKRNKNLPHVPIHLYLLSTWWGPIPTLTSSNTLVNINRHAQLHGADDLGRETTFDQIITILSI